MATTKQRSATQISLFILCFFSVWCLRATSLYSIDESIASDALRSGYSNLVKLILWGMPAFGFAYWVRHASPWRYLGLSIIPSIGQWVFYLGVTGLFLGAVTGFETVLVGKVFSFKAIALSITIPGLLSTLVSPLLEEILFRGLILKEFSSLLSGWVANLLTSLLFVGIHLPFWLSHEGFTRVVLANAAGIMVFSLVAGWLYLRSGSIWPPCLAHIANNCVALLLVTGHR